MPVCCVQIAVILPLGIGGLGGFGGSGFVQCAAQFVKLLFHSCVILQAAQGQAGNVICAVGGNFLAVNGAGALSFQHGFHVAGGFAGGKLCCAGSGVVGVILGQQVDAGRDINAANAAHAGRGGHGTARYAQQQHDCQSQTDEFLFHVVGSPYYTFNLPRGHHPQMAM